MRRRRRSPWWLAGIGGVLAFGVLRLTTPSGAATDLTGGPVPPPVPAGFLWGVATAGYQWEGGDTRSQWARWTATHAKEPLGRAADGWNRYEEDLDLAQAMGLNAFRFSIEWSRIEPRPGVIDGSAVAHYHAVLDAARARGLEPIVTLLHYTYPAWLDRPDARGLSGWESRESVNRYVKHVAFVAKEFGPKIRYYLTFNEPTVMVEAGYLAGVWPPGKQNDLPAFMRASGNLIKAHSRAFDAIHARDPDAQVSFNNYAAAYQLALNPKIDAIPAPGDDWFLNAFAAMLPKSETPGGAPRPKLDFVAVDYYKRLTIPVQLIPPSPSMWPVYPDGFLEVLERYHKVFKLPIMVAENGLATNNGKPRLDGWTRESYLVEHVAQVQKAIASGVPVFGYTYWTLTDNYEWGSFDDRFGLYRVECRKGDFTRHPTPAVDVYKAIVSNRGVTRELIRRHAYRPPALPTAPAADTPEKTPSEPHSGKPI